MGMIAFQRRANWWYWRARHWWFDQRGGRIAQGVALVLSLLLAGVQLGRVGLETANLAHGEPQQAVVWWVVQLIVMVVAAVISYALTPKQSAPTPQTSDAPTIEDGQTTIHHLGTCWVDDSFILAWKQMGTIPIKTKGGKK